MIISLASSEKEEYNEEFIDSTYDMPPDSGDERMAMFQVTSTPTTEYHPSVFTKRALTASFHNAAANGEKKNVKRLLKKCNFPLYMLNDDSLIHMIQL